MKIYNLKDAVAAIEYKEAARQGDAWAQCQLACMYLEGKGVGRSYKKAAQWLTSAADQNEPKAQCLLGYLYGTGKGVEKDVDKAIELLEKAMAQGHKYAREIRDCFVPF